MIVGGVGAALQGAGITTFDLDIVHSRADDNIDRLLTALNFLDAYYRTQPGKRLRPQASHLSSEGHQLLMTRYGPLDLLGAIGRSHNYDELLTHSTEMDAGEDVRVRVLNLDWLIAVKEETAGEKDRAVLPILRRTLQEKSRKL
ncbi:MAG: hypothetical protein ACRD4E_01970 [Bryobacteraceae bacterium]